MQFRSTNNKSAAWTNKKTKRYKDTNLFKQLSIIFAGFSTAIIQILFQLNFLYQNSTNNLLQILENFLHFIFLMKKDSQISLVACIIYRRISGRSCADDRRLYTKAKENIVRIDKWPREFRTNKDLILSLFLFLRFLSLSLFLFLSFSGYITGGIQADHIT